MFVETLEAIGTVQQGFDILSNLTPAISNLWKRFRAGGKRVVIFGPGGVGKSTLGNVFTNNKEVVKDSTPGQYNQSETIERFRSLESDIPFTLINPPGQEARAHTWQEVFRDIAAGKVQGIIHVVSYGYHAVRGELSTTVFSWYEDGMSQNDFHRKYVKFCREKELKNLEELIPHIQAVDNNHKPIWMITVVTKQDVWWEQRHEMESYYKNGRYNELIEKIYDKLGDRYFVHEYMSASLKFRIGEGYDLLVGFDNESYAFKSDSKLFLITFGWLD